MTQHILESDEEEIVWFTVDSLGMFLKYEYRVLWAFPFGLAVSVAGYQGLMYAVALLATILIMTLDLFVSVYVSVIFLRPVVRFLNAGRDVNSAVQSRGYLHLQKIKRSHLAGAIMAVSSSTLLYLNFAMWFIWNEEMSKIVWTHPLAFGVNADSVLNDLAMLVVCGVLR